MSASLILVLACVMLVTSFISGVFGMAGGIILMGLLLAVMPVASAMALHAVAQMAANAWRALLWWRYVRVGILLWTLVGSAAALGIFTFIAWVPEKGTAYIALGAMPFIIRPLPQSWAPNITRPGMPLFCGLLNQSLQLIAGVSGPTLDIFYVRSGLDRRVIVATKAAVQTFNHLLKLVYFTAIAVGAVRIELAWWLYALSVICSIAGTTASRGVLEKLTDKQFIVWNQRLIMALGLVYIAWGLKLSL